MSQTAARNMGSLSVINRAVFGLLFKGERGNFTILKYGYNEKGPWHVLVVQFNHITSPLMGVGTHLPSL